MSLFEVLAIALVVAWMVLASRGYFLENRLNASWSNTRGLDRLSLCATFWWVAGWTFIPLVWFIVTVDYDTFMSSFVKMLIAYAIWFAATRYMLFRLMAALVWRTKSLAH
jgi:hypothetical protein